MSSIRDLNSSAALFDRAIACKNGGKLEEALALFETLSRRHPRMPDVQARRGEVLMALRRWGEAAQAFDLALAERPDMPGWIRQRGVALQMQERFRDALAEYDRDVALVPDDAMGHYNRGTCLGAMDRLEEAVAAYDRALALLPDLVPALCNRGQALVQLGRMEEGLRDFDHSLRVAPDVQDAAVHKAVTLLLLGRFEAGWKFYEARTQMRRYRVKVPQLPIPPWTGREEIAGKTLLLHGEQGLGDTIQFCRYAKLAEARGAKVLLAPQLELRRLLTTLSPGIRVVDPGESSYSVDYHALLGSLPLAFGTRMATIPAAPSYLAAEPERVAKWAARIGSKGFRIGIAWQGAMMPYSDKRRAIPLAYFAALGRLPHVRLISLQKGGGAEQLDDPLFAAQVETLDPEFDAGPDSFLDSAAAMQSLDLVICCDTAIAHLAGALGRPVWVALRSTPDWRWLLGRSDTPWYPSMRLFRQTVRGDWSGVFQQIEDSLGQEIVRRFQGRA